MLRKTLCAVACATMLGPVLTACSSFTSPASTAFGPYSQASGFAPHGTPLTVTKREALLYVSEPALHSVAIYTYPGLRPRATLKRLGTPWGMCVDTGTGNVWIVKGAFGNEVVEFPHGGTTPIRSVEVPQGYYPDACAVDPTTGNLAVAAINDNDDPGSLLVYRGARGTPVVYFTRAMFFYYFVGYDASGNAFVDGNGNGGFRLAELPAGGGALKIVHYPGNVQYDGQNVAVGAEKSGLVYRIAHGLVIGKTMLYDICDVRQFYIDGTQLIAPNVCGSKGEVLVYNYPGGGAPVGKISGLSSAFGAVVSR